MFSYLVWYLLFPFYHFEIVLISLSDEQMPDYSVQLFVLLREAD